MRPRTVTAACYTRDTRFFICNAIVLDGHLQRIRPDMSEPPDELEQEGRYANVFKVGFNAYEFVIDFGQQYDAGEARTHTRIVTSPAMAQNLRDVLDRSVREYGRLHPSLEKER